MNFFKLPSLFKVPTHKQFRYSPRYYDADKEEREKKKQEKSMGGNHSEQNKLKIHELYDKRKKGKNFSGNAKSFSNKRIIIIIIALLFLAYFLLK